MLLEFSLVVLAMLARLFKAIKFLCDCHFLFKHLQLFKINEQRVFWVFIQLVFFSLQRQLLEVRVHIGVQDAMLLLVVAAEVHSGLDSDHFIFDVGVARDTLVYSHQSFY